MKLVSSENPFGRAQVLVAPTSAYVPTVFQTVREDPGQRAMLIAHMERLRADVYLRDGAIRSTQLTADGRHHTDADDRSWHLLTLDEEGRVGGCVRFYLHSNTTSFDDLTVSRAALAKCPTWGAKFRACIESEMRRARHLNVPFVELGGWALADHLRHSTEAVKIALGAFAWGQLLGGAIGVTTATTRNHSSSILSRIGGKSLTFNKTELPEYYDPQYGCTMAILHFEAFSCERKYRSLVAGLAEQLASTPVYCDRVTAWQVSDPVRPDVPRYAKAAIA